MNMTIWTCFSCGTEYETETVPRCKECIEPLCNDCYAEHMDDHWQPTNWKQVAWTVAGIVAFAALLLTLLSLGGCAARQPHYDSTDRHISPAPVCTLETVEGNIHKVCYEPNADGSWRARISD